VILTAVAGATVIFRCAGNPQTFKPSNLETLKPLNPETDFKMIDELVKQKIKAARSEVDRSELIAPDHKDSLQGLLDHAERCANGTPDKIAALADAFADLLVRTVRTEVRALDERSVAISCAIKDHAEICKLSRRTGIKGVMDSFLQQYPTLAVGILIYLIHTGKLTAVLQLIGVVQ